MIHGEIMETKKVGRPKKLKLVRIETSIEVVRDELKAKYPYDLSIATKKTPTKKRIQNMIAPGRKELTNYGEWGCPLLDLDEVLKKFVG